MDTVAVILDLDGVLSISETVHLAAEQAALAEHERELSKAQKQPFVGLANAERMQTAALAAGIRCVAIPTVSEPLDPEFGRAHLLFPAGMGSADVEEILEFIAGS